MTIAQVLFEVSYEVCNKVGGIHTVVSSKAALLKAAYKNYYLIGPYTNSVEFDEQPIPNYLQTVAQQLSIQGIVLHYGIWRIAGKPEVLLLEFFGVQSKLNKLKAQLWESFQAAYPGGFNAYALLISGFILENTHTTHQKYYVSVAQNVGEIQKALLLENKKEIWKNYTRCL
ncbi:MAG: hypothetical protein ACMXYC_03505 [Candidatus Woesearchaeota archaeon]